MTDNKPLLESFKLALKLEQDGKAFFLKAAADTQSRLARQTFQYLASEEDRHIKTIESFIDSLSIPGEELTTEVEDIRADQKLEDFNARLDKMQAEFKPAASDIEAYEYALKFEDGAEDFYQEILNETSHPQVKKFYRWLIAEEKMHSRLLKSCLRFVQDPAGWFSKRKG